MSVVGSTNSLKILAEASSMAAKAPQSPERQRVRAMSLSSVDEMTPSTPQVLQLPRIQLGPYPAEEMQPISSGYIGSSPRKYKLLHQDRDEEAGGGTFDVPASGVRASTGHANNAYAYKYPPAPLLHLNNHPDVELPNIASLNIEPTTAAMSSNGDQQSIDGDSQEFSDVPGDLVVNPDGGLVSISQELVDIRAELHDHRGAIVQLMDCSQNMFNALAVIHERIGIVEGDKAASVGSPTEEKDQTEADASPTQIIDEAEAEDSSSLFIPETDADTSPSQEAAANVQARARSAQEVTSRRQTQGLVSTFRPVADDRSRSPTPETETEVVSVHSLRELRERTSPAKAKGKGRQKPTDLRIIVPDNHMADPALPKLSIEVPGKLSVVDPLAGIPTPVISNPPSAYTPTTGSLSASLSGSLSGLAVASPLTPLTPQFIGPPSGMKKSSTSINKRSNHNLDKMVPSTWAQLPNVPLTDTEIIVFFFNALSRPIVSLRLYANNWGPKDICDVLNEHRAIDPPYLRNTCSVKCTTAIKKGRAEHGTAWEETHRKLFYGASIVVATDLCRLQGSQATRAPDFEIRSLSIGLKKYPVDNVFGGIFTRCVKYCDENNLDYKLSNVKELADQLVRAEADAWLDSLPTPDEFRAQYLAQESARIQAEAAAAKDDAEAPDNKSSEEDIVDAPKSVPDREFSPSQLTDYNSDDWK